MTKSLINTIKVRGWKDSDFNDSVTLNREAEEHIGMTSENGDWEKDMQDITKTFLDGGGKFFLGFIDEKLVVMGGYKKLTNTEAEVKRMRVTPALQGKGIGRWFLTMLETEMIDSGITEAKVSTMSVQTGALRLYGGSHYKETGRKVQEEGPEKGLIQVSFSKKLKQVGN